MGGCATGRDCMGWRWGWRVTRKITKPWALPVVLIPGTTCCAGAQPGDEVMKDRDGDSRATASWPDDVIARCANLSLPRKGRLSPSFSFTTPLLQPVVPGRRSMGPVLMLCCVILFKSLPLSGLLCDMRLNGSENTSSRYFDQSSPKILILWGGSDREARVPGKGGC